METGCATLRQRAACASPGRGAGVSRGPRGRLIDQPLANSPTTLAVRSVTLALDRRPGNRLRANVTQLFADPIFRTTASLFREVFDRHGFAHASQLLDRSKFQKLSRHGQLREPGR